MWRFRWTRKTNDKLDSNEKIVHFLGDEEDNVNFEINDDVSEPELNNKNISESDDLNSYENNNQFNVIRENDSEIQMEPTSIEWSLFDEKDK